MATVSAGMWGGLKHGRRKDKKDGYSVKRVRDVKRAQEWAQRSPRSGKYPSIPSSNGGEREIFGRLPQKTKKAVRVTCFAHWGGPPSTYITGGGEGKRKNNHGGGGEEIF